LLRIKDKLQQYSGNTAFVTLKDHFEDLLGLEAPQNDSSSKQKLLNSPT